MADNFAILLGMAVVATVQRLDLGYRHQRVVFDQQQRQGFAVIDRAKPPVNPRVQIFVGKAFSRPRGGRSNIDRSGRKLITIIHDLCRQYGGGSHFILPKDTALWGVSQPLYADPQPFIALLDSAGKIHLKGQFNYFLTPHRESVCYPLILIFREFRHSG